MFIMYTRRVAEGYIICSHPLASIDILVAINVVYYTIFRRAKRRRAKRRGDYGSVSPEVAAEAGVAGEFVGLDEE